MDSDSHLGEHIKPPTRLLFEKGLAGVRKTALIFS